MGRRMFTAAVVALVLISAVFGVGVVLVLGAQCAQGRRQYDALHAVIDAATDVPPGSPYEAQAAELRGRLHRAQGRRPAC